MGRKLKYTTEEIISKCITKHGNLYDYSRLLYTGIQNKCTIGCLKHGYFEQIIADHINGAGCPSCGGTRANIKRILTETTESKIDRYQKIHLKRKILNNYKEAGKKAYLTSISTTADNGKTVFENRVEKMKNTRIGRGSYNDPNSRSDYQKYKASVYYYTRKNRKLLSEQYPVKNKHLDHKYSIFSGFKNNIAPSIIGHVCNLEYIPERNNRTKHIACSITLNDLLNDIKAFG